MRTALNEAELHAGDVSVIYGHGRGRAAEDRREIQALSRLTGGRAVPVCCVNGNTGLAEASSGLFSVAAAVIGMQNGEAYPIVTGGRFEDSLHFVQRQVRRGDYPNALIAGSTEYGNNAAVILERGISET
jgi:3-oxoacyl-(acyl-carrier-protein) synthase